MKKCTTVPVVDAITESEGSSSSVATQKPANGGTGSVGRNRNASRLMKIVLTSGLFLSTLLLTACDRFGKYKDPELISFSNRTFESLIGRNGIWIDPTSGKPFTGEVAGTRTRRGWDRYFVVRQAAYVVEGEPATGVMYSEDGLICWKKAKIGEDFYEFRATGLHGIADCDPCSPWVLSRGPMLKMETTLYQKAGEGWRFTPKADGAGYAEDEFMSRYRNTPGYCQPTFKMVAAYVDSSVLRKFGMPSWAVGHRPRG